MPARTTVAPLFWNAVIISSRFASVCFKGNPRRPSFAPSSRITMDGVRSRPALIRARPALVQLPLELFGVAESPGQAVTSRQAVAECENNGARIGGRGTLSPGHKYHRRNNECCFHLESNHDSGARFGQ